MRVFVRYKVKLVDFEVHATDREITKSHSDSSTRDSVHKSLKVLKRQKIIEISYLIIDISFQL